MLSIQSGKFLAHKHRVADSFYAPARDRVERGRAQRFPSAQAETGVMQGTSQGVSNHQTLRKHSVIMSAVCANREKLVTAARQDEVFAIYLPEGHRSVGKITNENSISKIRFLDVFRFCHISTYARVT
jgi:hypothetical protein